MFETELKFQVPPARREALQRAIATATARTTRLQAVYADTADHRLAANGLALRLRKEGRVWVQTLKGRGDSLMQRLEHEVRLPAAAGVPALDATRHAGSAVGQRLLALLADGAVLQPVYRTDIRRLHRRVRHCGALIELAYDRGRILAGERLLEVDEIEFELVRGPGASLVDLAARWAARFGLWWDVRTKSERGHRLALGLDQVPATRAAAVALPVAASPAQALASWAAGALQQALPNAAEIASGTAQPEHLHQLRAALRRLRSVLRVYADFAVDPAAALALEADWREPFGQLGAARDQDVLCHSLVPQLNAALQAAGAPLLPALPPDAGRGPADIVCDAGFTALLLRSLVLCAAPPVVQEGGSPSALVRAVGAALRPLWRQVRRGAADFGAADAQTRHRLRKRIKRLRDALACAMPLLKRKPAAALMRRLARSLKSLGELNDLQVAVLRYGALAQRNPQALLAVGFLAARQQPAVDRAAAALARLRRDGVSTGVP